ncbi:MAG: phytanoyl-CoA dioxygenase family protein [Pseudomonadota bacterium]
MALAEMNPQSSDMGTAYEENGFICPIDVLSEAETRELRRDLETAEAELAGDPERLKLLYSYPDRLLPSFDRLIRHPALISAATAALGPDLMVWSAGLFIKEARSPKIVSWHQDLTYWGLDDAQETTLWFALSPATRESGCMRFVPGSHKQTIVPHIDTFADDNLLSRGQEIAVEVDEADAVAAELRPGQASMHHGHLFHASGPNVTDDRRIGAAIRYIVPSMKQKAGGRPLVALVNGEDSFNNFTIADAPRARLSAADFEMCKADAKLREKLLFEGVDR